ncbi:MAG: D-alanine--D-alanine ligase [Flavobacteriia bacterium]|nr:D-alanine--D-alanine ligase [Flavobacteriia bacterium]
MKIVGLFCGGYSSEYDISLKSATTIKTHFPKEYIVYKILVREDKWQVESCSGLVSFDLNTCSFIENKVHIRIDIGLVYIHGNPGENGKIQAFLDLHSIPYLNSGPLASALSFDKWFCNQFLKSFNVPVAKSLFMTCEDQFSASFICSELGLPLFVKPSDSGSSYGISKVKSLGEIPTAITNAFTEGKSIVLESFLDGIEVTCGVYRTKKGLIALPLTEIASENDFFDYDAKYNGKSQEITPARVSDKAKSQVQERSKYIYELLQLRSIARIDFMLVKDEAFVIEVNTTPGFSSESIVPKMLACEGKSIHDFWAEIIEAEL